MPDMKWMSASVYGYRALSARALAAPERTTGPWVTGWGEVRTVPRPAPPQADAIAATRAAAIPALREAVMHSPGIRALDSTRMYTRCKAVVRTAGHCEPPPARAVIASRRRHWQSLPSAPGGGASR